jgi:ribosomal protein S17E
MKQKRRNYEKIKNDFNLNGQEKRRCTWIEKGKRCKNTVAGYYFCRKHFALATKLESCSAGESDYRTILRY